MFLKIFAIAKLLYELFRAGRDAKLWDEQGNKIASADALKEHLEREVERV